MLQLLLFAEEEEKTLEQTDLVMSDVMALLRSLSFITDPTVMYKFLGDEVRLLFTQNSRLEPLLCE